MAPSWPPALPDWAVPPADLLRSPRVVGLALSLQLLAAAGAVSGPWSVLPAAAAVAPAAPAPVAAPVAAAGPVRLSAAGLWDGVVEAQPLGLDGSGALSVPATAGGLGWWADGPRPGSDGAAVVVGHVDLGGRPGVFGRLAQARPGTVVSVMAGSEVVRYRVVSVQRYAKTAFPTDVVYRPTGAAELRLVTCGGRFDPRTGHYEDNVVVQAVRA